MVIYEDIIQQSPEWFALKLGKMSASKALAIKTGGKGLETLALQLAIERYTGCKEGVYTNSDMQRGIEEEDMAAILYSIQTGDELYSIGLSVWNDYVSCSPDRLIVGKDKGVEIKSQNNIRHGEIVMGKSEFDSKYIAQAEMCSLIMGYDTWDLCSFNPHFRDKSLFVKEIKLTEESKEKILKGFELGEKLIKQHYEKLING